MRRGPVVHIKGISSIANMKNKTDWAEIGQMHIKIAPRSFVVTLLFATSLAFSSGVIFARVPWFNLTFESMSRPFDIDLSTPTTKQAPPSKSGVALSGRQQANHFEDRCICEALTHPAMITHPNPKRVVIIGGRYCCALGEVLKHQGVEKVTVVDVGDDLDEMMCTRYTEAWLDMYDGQMPLVQFEEGSLLFDFDRREDREGKVDVIIMNQPRKARSFFNTDRKESNQFERSLRKMLSKEGVFVARFEADKDGDGAMLQAMNNADVGFESIHIYDVDRVDFLISFKDHSSRASWFKTSAEMEVELHRRLRRSKLSDPSLLFFDAPTMIGFQVPSKKHEADYCGQEDTPKECEEYLGFDPGWVNIPTSHLETKKSTAGEFAGRGLFAAKDIPAGAIFDMKTDVSSFWVSPSTWHVIDELCEFPIVEDELTSMVTFIEGYGYGDNLLGKMNYVIDAGIMTFCNHGCNGTYSYGVDAIEGFTEITVDLGNPPEGVLREMYPYSPVFERHLQQAMGTSTERTLRDIEKGEEVLCNYLDFVGRKEYWEEEVLSLRGQCTGEIMGTIAGYEFEVAAI